MELSPRLVLLVSRMDHPPDKSRVDTPEECKGIVDDTCLPRIREEMNAYDNNTAMERAWFSIARGAMAQTDALLRFEALYDAHLALKERFRGEHAGCVEKLISAERERDELRAVSADQASHIKELEAELARKDSEPRLPSPLIIEAWSALTALSSSLSRSALINFSAQPACSPRTC
ncbi:hypothetical protein Tco_0540167 [Tanacetum coccineum]